VTFTWLLASTLAVTEAQKSHTKGTLRNALDRQQFSHFPYQDRKDPSDPNISNYTHTQNMASTKKLHLSILNQTTYRRYIRDLIILPFPDISRSDDALRALRAGLSLRFFTIHILAGSLITNPAMSFLEATYPDPLPFNVGDIMLVSNDAYAADPELDYHAMEKEGFPPSRLPSRKVCPLSLQKHPGLSDSYAKACTDPTHGVPIPILRAQAPFVPRGLILSVYWHHSVVDGAAIDLLFEKWSSYVKDFKDDFDFDSAASKIVQVDSSAPRLALDAFMSDPQPVPSYEPLAVQPDRHPRPVVRSEPYKSVAKIVFLPAASIAALKAELEALAATRISTFVTLTSLMWENVIRARGPSLKAAGTETIALGIAVHLGKRLGPDFPQDYTGNLAPPDTTRYPFSDITGTPDFNATHLLPLALAMKATIAEASPEWLEERLRYFSSFPDPSQVFTGTFFANTACMFVTSWQHLGADLVWGIPGTNADGRASALRKPSYLSEGMRILPRRDEEDADYQMLVIYEEGDMGRLIEGLGDYADRVIEG